jgi:hypothetical protein
MNIWSSEDRRKLAKMVLILNAGLKMDSDVDAQSLLSNLCQCIPTGGQPSWQP